jgi:vacuole membrane protein 1
MSKVRIESFMWGLGTAIGELPPYFMARASALSSTHNGNSKKEAKKSKLLPGQAAIVEDEIDEELAEFEQLLEAEKNGSPLSFIDKMRVFVYRMVNKVGFWGILLCASIPNPLFDLAGITCGHFLVRFTTFFGATVIGKAIIKMHIQKLFVIFLFSQHHLDTILYYLSKIPKIGERIQPFMQEWLLKEKKKLHTSAGHSPAESTVSWILGKIVLIMILFFVFSIVNSLAQRRFKRLNSFKLTSSKIHD